MIFPKCYYYSKAILRLNNLAEFKAGNTYSEIEWFNINPIDEKVLELEVEAIMMEETKDLYKQQRSLEYPSIGDQLDALFKAGVFPKEMADQIQAVKDKYPK